MKNKIVNKLRFISILGLTSLVFSSLLLTNRNRGVIKCLDNEGYARLKDFSRPNKTTPTRNRRLTYQRRNSAFQLLGYANMALMKKMEEERPMFRYLLEPWETKCRDNAADKKDVAWSMIVAVKSNAMNIYRRQFIRDTWGSYKYSNNTRLEVIFIVGLPTNAKQQDVISVENRMNGDILQINKTEEYEDVGLKVIAGMQWVAEKCQSNWIYASADDDMVPYLVNFYQMFDSQRIGEMLNSREIAIRFPIICNFNLKKDEGPIRRKTEKNYVPPEIYSEETYPTFCAGGFYSMSIEVCKILLRLSRSHKYFYNDDVWITGLLRLAAIDAGHIPCDDVTYERCGMCTAGSTNVRHFEGNIENMFRFWEKQMGVDA